MGKNNRRGRNTPKKAAATKTSAPSPPEFLACVQAEAGARPLLAEKVLDKVKADANTFLPTVNVLASALTGGSADEQHAALVCAQALATGVSGSWAVLAQKVLPAALDLSAHKKRRNIREAADLFADTLSDITNVPIVAVTVLPAVVITKMGTASKWQTKVAGMKMLHKLALSSDAAVQLLLARQMPALVPVVSELMWSTKRQVQTEATDAMTALCGIIGNPDLEPFTPLLVNAITHPEEVVDTVHKLASTTFVQTVTAAALSIMVPLLARGFTEKKVSVKRKAAVVTENLAKLVADPSDVVTFLPVLAPALAKAVAEVSDPECRDRCDAAHKQLMKLSNKTSDLVIPTPADVGAVFKGVEVVAPEALALCATAAKELLAVRNYSAGVWAAGFAPTLALVCFGGDMAKANAAVEKAMDACREKFGSAGAATKQVDEDLEDQSEELCDCKFSLAYGSNILLNSTRLRLKRGKRYGIIASKSAGKTTLLRAIANYQIDGFPSADELRTIFVETDIQGKQTTMNVVEFVMDTIKHIRVMEEKEVTDILGEMGFNLVMQNGPITALSGGWKMKLALVRGMLCKTDIYLMDEPTNHLDVLNVQWVVDYLTGPLCEKVTSLIVSHDSKFLDKVCTHVVHFDDLKLCTYPGNLSSFVKRKPETASYFELGQSALKFFFPVPKMIAGIKTKSTRLMALDKVDFRYPGAEKNQINNVSVACSMASRVAIVGANGAGKSTMIKVLTGELEPTRGKVIKHPEMRFAYVAQHAFHHIEQHLNKTPNEYIRWRYSSGEDKEALIKSTAIITPAEEKIMEQPIEVAYVDENGNNKKGKWVIKRIVSRRKVRKSYQYEVTFENRSMDDNRFYTPAALEKFGWIKKVKELNRRLVALEGLQNRPLTVQNVEKHLKAVGLESEFATHNRLCDLSGGQKVKVVLGACTWAQPHLIILDEPTNYLDRDSLGALAGAIRDFGGGVVLITHNQEFADATTKVTWVVANHQVTVNGDAEWEKYAAEQAVMVDAAAQGEQRDASGNIVEVKFKAKPFEELTKKETMKFKKAIRKKLKKGNPLEDWEEEYGLQWDLC